MKGLHLSTSTVNCSVAVSDHTETLSCVEEFEDKLVHAEKLHVFMEQCLKQSKVKASELSYLCVDIGPGSYTGLRIGVSAIKGLAYALQIPVVSMTSPEILMSGWSQEGAYAEGDKPLAMIDARRMEVYQQWGDSQGIPQGDILATILDSETFAKQRDQYTVHLLGDSSDKAMSVWSGDTTLRVSKIKYPSASHMPLRAHEKFLAQDFVDTAYFEPFYLKDFVAGKPKKLL